MTSKAFRDPPAKKTVRGQWNTPFLRYLHDTYQIKYRYMGLPGPDVYDILLWRDMIEEVIAFERLSPGKDNREYIAQLKMNLRKMSEIKAKVYAGSMEEVVMLRRDLDNVPYIQDKVITLYNLDFCDEISSLVDTREYGKRRWRLDALRVIIEDQRECFRIHRCDGYFIILITMRNQINSSNLREMLAITPYPETQLYRTECEQEKAIPTQNEDLIGKHTWAIKALVYNYLKRYLNVSGISSILFPFIKYQGTPIKMGTSQEIQSPMLHWMVFCKLSVENGDGLIYLPDNYLKNVATIEATATELKITPILGEAASTLRDINSVNWFKLYENAFFEPPPGE